MMSSKITVVLLIGLVAGGSLGYFYSYTLYTPQIYDLETKLSEKTGELKREQSRVLVLEEKLSITENRLSNAEYSIVKLQEELLDVKKVKESLEAQVSSYRNQVIHLNSEIDSLEKDKLNLEIEIEFLETIRIGTSLETYYDNVRANVVTLGGNPLGEEEWWNHPNYYENSVWLASCMAAHDAGNLYWPFFETVYNETVGEVSSHTAYYILDDFLFRCDVYPSESVEIKIDKILGFVNSVITFETRLLDHMWFPTETLTFGSGDCTSFSILIASLFEMVDIKSAIGFFFNDQGDAHAMVLINCEELPNYTTWGFDDLTSYGLSSGRWIIIESQYSSLADQEKYQDDWIPQWNLEVASEVKYGA